MSSIALLIITGSIWATSLHRNLPGDVGLQLVQDGRARAVDLGLQEAPEAEVEGGRGQGARRPLSAPKAPSTDHCVLKLVVQIPHVSTRKRSYI